MKRVLESRRFGLLLGAIAFAVFLGLAVPASANSLAPATFVEYAGIFGTAKEGNDQYLAESVSLHLAVPGGGGGDAFARATNMPPVSAEAGLQIDLGQGNFGATSTVQTRYQFAVEPLAPGLPQIVPVNLSASGLVSVDTNSSFISHTFARIDHPGGQWQADNYDAYGSYTGVFSFDKSQTLNLPVNTAQTISIYVLTHAQPPGTYYNTRAFLDPLIEIDPAFPDRDQFRIVYSEGILPVPVPSSVWLLTSGLLSLAGFRRFWGKDT